MALTLAVVAYDIADDRRRTKAHKLLEAYGVPVQESVFLVELSARHWDELARRMLTLVDRAEDDVQVWPLCALCRSRAQVWCGTPRAGAAAVEIV